MSGEAVVKLPAGAVVISKLGLRHLLPSHVVFGSPQFLATWVLPYRAAHNMAARTNPRGKERNSEGPRRNAQFYIS